MKGIAVIALYLMAGCAAGPTLEELEAQALVSGDWSAVEARERAIARRKVREGTVCPARYVSVCSNYGMPGPCTCIEAAQLYSALGLR
jgi:hypothetical protein